MNLVSVTASAVIKIFLMTAAGFIAAKAKVLTAEVSAGCTKVLISVCTPMMIISSFFKEYDPALLKGMGISLVLAVLYFAIGIALGLVLIKKESRDVEVERICMMYQNIGFVGIPIAQMLFGQDGVIFMAVHLVMFNLMFFTHAIMVYSGKITKESFVKSLKTPAIPAIITGLVLFLGKISLPAEISGPITSIGNCSTPLGMMIAGGIIERSNLKDVLKNKRAYLVCIVKMIVLPLIILLVCRAFDIDQTISVCAIIMAACPMAAFDVMFSELYGKNSAYASGMFGLTTISCVAVIPLFIMFYGIL